MKKRFLSIVSVMLVASMMAATVTGCGSRTKATDITIDDGDTIIVDEEDLETEKDTEVESDTDDITETEVIGGDAEETETKIDSEDGIPTIDYGYLVIYDKVFKPEIEIDWDSFNVLNTPEEYTFNEDTNVYGTNGELVGYVRAGSEVTFNNRNDDWFRFNPNTEGVTYPYLMVRVEELKENTNEEVNEIYKLSPEKVKEMIMEDIGARDEAPTFLEAPTSDMEFVEFTLWNKRDELVTKEDIMKSLHEVELNTGNFSVASYLTFYIECTGDEEKVDCIVYYKDKEVIE